MRNKPSPSMVAILTCLLVLTLSSAVWSFQKQIPARMAENPKSAFVPSDDEKTTTFCTIYKDDGGASWIFGGFNAGLAFSVYVDPGLCLREPPYPFRVTDVHFDLVPLGLHDAWPVNLQFSIKQVAPGGKCMGPSPTSSLYSESFAFPEDSSYYNIPAFINYTLSQPFCVWEPFFLEIMYLDEIQEPDTLPSFSMDAEADSVDSCESWAMWEGEYYKWTDFWSSPPPGDPIIRITGYTEAEDCPDLWYWKPDKPEQEPSAPSGMPDFDQNQDEWVGYCGPVAVANCLWWYGAVPPGWTPPQLIDTLARYFHTHPPYYTFIDSMKIGIGQYLQDYGFAYQETTFEEPDFHEMEDSLKKCQDVILLLGFWWYSDQAGQWYREGGHFVTMSGVCSESLKIAISDPDNDMAVGGWPGRVRPPSHPSLQDYEATLHNDPQYVSHDMYQSTIEIPFPSPGNAFWEINYPWVRGKFSGMNVPEKFLPVSRPAPEGGKDLWVTEVEYAVMICPTPSAVGDEPGTSVPRYFELDQNYPNPFNAGTVIKFNLQRPADVNLTIYNILGQRVRTLAEGRMPAGSHTLNWDGRDEKGLDLSSGVYFYRLQAGEQAETKRLILLK
jgi:hypothetical protein